MAKILIGCPTYDNKITADLIPFFVEAAKSEHEIIFEKIKRCPTPVARNKMVEKAQQLKTHLVFVDADAIPAPGTFNIFIEKILSEECVVGIPYCAPQGHIVDGAISPPFKIVKDLEGWHPTDFVSTHCCAYNINVFNKITKPYYYYEFNHYHTAIPHGVEDSTCHNAMYKQGVKFYVNYSYWAGHVVEKILEKPQLLDKNLLALLHLGADD